MTHVDNSLEAELVQQAANDEVNRFVVGAIVGRLVAGTLSILVLQRAGEDFMGGIEELPSGKVDGDESLLAALSREVQEETGLAVEEVIGYLFSFDYVSASGRRTRQFNFVTRTSRGDVLLNAAEHDSYRWLSYDQIHTSSLTDNIKSELYSAWVQLDSSYAANSPDE